MAEINNTVFMALIKGLKYSDKSKDYTYKHNKYKLAKVQADENKSIEQFYFVNINEPTDIKVVSAIGGIPTYDGFNGIKVDTKLRKLEYLRVYYKKVLVDKRQKASADKREKREKERKEKREQKKIELQSQIQEKYTPIKCAYCGVEFTPHAKNQKFHTDECRKRYYSEKQAEQKKEENLVEKVCPICNSTFKGTPREKYCSKKCYKLAQKGNRRLRYEKEKVNKIESEKAKKPKKKAVVVKKKNIK